ncbi:unnamed protein product [Peronospora belbahrii]|uniref:Kinase n=1 Tax=Peronospora belbahrii TaxID=622444 RepID=A0ABN8D625_9STRA|nr:unnamed protein product [Peronospora belbahrii]
MTEIQGFVHQVGGHSTAKTSLKALNGRILKPFQNKQRGERERDFYERVFVSEKESTEFAALMRFLPTYYGTIVAPQAEDKEEEMTFVNGECLVLEDLTWGRQWPCIMDVKMGTRSYEEDASAEKIAFEKSKFPLQETVGLRIQGIKVFDPQRQSYVEFDKVFGRAITSVDELALAFRRYFPVQDTIKTIKLLEAFLRRLDQLKTWFDDQQGTMFIASSFLFLYDGVESVEEAKLTSEAYKADIRLIDFAHVTHPSLPKHDEGMQTGITTLTECFRTLLRLETLDVTSCHPSQ